MCAAAATETKAWTRGFCELGFRNHFACMPCDSLSVAACRERVLLEKVAARDAADIGDAP